MNKIVLDLETQKEFAEVGGRSSHGKLRVSVCGIYSYEQDQYLCFDESNLTKLGEILQETDLVIGYNIKDFDFQVLQPYFNFSMDTVPALDILQEVEKVLGHRIRLEAIAQATLGTGKTGSGLAAIGLWRSGKLEELKSYCLNDVKLTRDVYEYAKANGKLLFQDFFETREIAMNIQEPAPRINTVVQSSLF
ncbi:MAG: hypothetical protein A2751_00310 [Candidatus Doudnabacteria bacterium RIFCSPHIGHO2_01_FULL_46_14]|uniref:YprB ribonuclease H-like domain-containing protein n=1 Tax=Candidatus Doudnabacteria bacterium RIFCSPHIGHO2_01_FULL_46_14 TaxID=1817824 RepID=A0A1F5NPC4_9BACT|nr:MAG: hypothetical protein A2751_00310 [Candidatus Doudnabacteria bacterium RIFCSPHIGHO2_01_FULL_46_14]